MKIFLTKGDRMKRAILALFAAAAILPATVFAQAKGAGAHDRETIKHRLNPHGLDSVPAGSTGVVTPPISYYGGSLITTPNIYYIWYGNWNRSTGSDTAAGQQILRDLALNIGASPYFTINTT